MRRPLVGFPGAGNHIAIEHRTDGIACRVSTSSYVWLLVCTGAFGPFMVSLLYFWPEKLEPTPSLILGAVWFLSLLGSGVFVRYALGCPRFMAHYGTGDILYFGRWGSTPSLILRRGEIRAVEIEERFFLNEGSKVPNWSITATTHADQRYALCVSTNEQLIRGLKEELEKIVLGTVSGPKKTSPTTEPRSA